MTYILSHKLCEDKILDTLGILFDVILNYNIISFTMVLH